MTKGTRVELIFMDDEYTTLKPGDKGTVDYIDDAENIHVKWDNGSTLSLIPNVDDFKIIDDINESILKFNEMFDTEELKSEHEIDYLSGNLKISNDISNPNNISEKNIIAKLATAFPYIGNHEVTNNPKYPRCIFFHERNDVWYTSFSLEVVTSNNFNMFILYKKVETDKSLPITRTLDEYDDKIHGREFNRLSFRDVTKIMDGIYLPILKDCKFVDRDFHRMTDN